MAAGLACMMACVAIGAVVGQHFVHYLTALLLLGIGWNFLFVAGTTLLTTTYAPSERFAAQGLNDVVVFGTQAVASLLAGPAILRLGWPTLNAASLPLLLAMAGAVVWLGGRQRGVGQAGLV
jgi:predicted MFS family arabinose efflux permease